MALRAARMADTRAALSHNRFRIFAKRLPGQTILADWWTPDASLPVDDGSVRAEIVWASLDCPGDALHLRRAVAGRCACRVDRCDTGSIPAVRLMASQQGDTV
jgi:hypothetical protein